MSGGSRLTYNLQPLDRIQPFLPALGCRCSISVASREREGKEGVDDEKACQHSHTNTHKNPAIPYGWQRNVRRRLAASRPCAEEHRLVSLMLPENAKARKARSWLAEYRPTYLARFSSVDTLCFPNCGGSSGGDANNDGAAAVTAACGSHQSSVIGVIKSISI